MAHLNSPALGCMHHVGIANPIPRSPCPDSPRSYLVTTNLTHRPENVPHLWGSGACGARGPLASLIRLAGPGRGDAQAPYSASRPCSPLPTGWNRRAGVWVRLAHARSCRGHGHGHHHDARHCGPLHGGPRSCSTLTRVPTSSPQTARTRAGVWRCVARAPIGGTLTNKATFSRTR